MKILFTVEYYFPSIGGAQTVVRQLAERFVKNGHDVWVATTKLQDRKFTELAGVKIREFQIKGNMVNGLSGEIETYQNFLLNNKFDVIINYAAQQWSTDVMLPILDKISAKKVLVPCGFSGLYQAKYKDYFIKMKDWLKKYDACVYLSKNYRDINFARHCGATNSVFIPNGADESEFEFKEKSTIDIKKLLNIPDNHKLILCVGSHSGLKGHREAMEIFTLSRIKNSTLLIVANDFNAGCSHSCEYIKKLLNVINKFNNKKIIIKTLSRLETVSAFLAADLFLFPSNIEYSPLVLFESMASRTAFLTTDVGNATEIIEWSHGGRLLPTKKKLDGFSKAKIFAFLYFLAVIIE